MGVSYCQSSDQWFNVRIDRVHIFFPRRQKCGKNIQTFEYRWNCLAACQWQSRAVNILHIFVQKSDVAKYIQTYTYGASVPCNE